MLLLLSAGAAVLTCVLPVPLFAQARTGTALPRVAGYVQPRFTTIGDSAAFLVRRARIGVQGSLTPWAGYKAQAEFRSGGTGAGPAGVSATDLYVALAHREWSITVGQLKTPFSREGLMSSSVIELPERALAVDAIWPNRDVGLMVQWGGERGEREDRVTVQGGAFNGDGINRAGNRDKRLLYVARLRATAAAGVDVGASVAAAPDSTAWGVEADVRRAGWTLRAEYITRHRDASGDDATGWYALGAYRVPRRALQLVARLEQLDPTEAPGDRTSGYTGGLQYFFRGDDLKVLASYTVFREQGASLDNDRVILQMQARF